VAERLLQPDGSLAVRRRAVVTGVRRGDEVLEPALSEIVGPLRSEVVRRAVVGGRLREEVVGVAAPQQRGDGPQREQEHDEPNQPVGELPRDRSHTAGCDGSD